MREKIRAKNFVGALWVNERYNEIFKNNKKILTNKKAMENWFAQKSLISKEDYKVIFKTMNYKEDIFSHAIDSEVLGNGIFSEAVKENEWFKVFADTIEAESVKDVSDISVEKMDYYLIIRNFLNYAESKLVGGRLTSKVVDCLLKSFMTKLLEIAHKTIVLEINIARVTEVLKAETSHKRYCEFFENFKNIEVMVEFYEKYPVLTRLLSSCTINFLNNVNDFADRYFLHKEEIYQNFKISKKAELESVSIGLGDTHEKGKSVLMLNFSDNSKVIYKPKNLEIALAYNQFCNKLNYLAGEVYIKTYKILCYHEYTFEEFICKEDCKDVNEIKDFYTNFGRLSAVLFYLKGNDFHRENIIASGTYPVAIDLETLLQQSNGTDYDNNFYMQQKKRISSESVARTSIFPNGSTDSKIDMSAFDGTPKQIPFEVETVVDEKLDTIRYEYVTQDTGVCNNQVCFDGKEVNAFDYVDEVIEGFKQMYYLILNHKQEILQYIQVFENKKIRILIRNTMNYARLQNMALHPKYLRDATKREKIFENLWKYCLSEKSFHKSEVIDMLEDDIPIFFSNTSSMDVMDAAGNIFKNYYSITGMEALKKETEELSEKGLAKQISLLLLLTDRYSPIEKSRTEVTPIRGVINKVSLPRNYIECAAKIGDYLMEQVHYSSDQKLVAYDMVSQAENGKWIIDIMRDDFYNGYSGIELFFRYLFEATGTKKYAEFADILNHGAETCAEISNIDSAISGKWSGLTVDILCNKNLLSEEEMLNKFKEITETEKLDYTDWLGGVASVVQLLYLQFEKTHNKKFLDLAEEMLSKMKKTIEDANLLGGFAHGYSSLAYLFGKAYSLTQKDSYLKFCEKLIEKDNVYLVPEKREWADGRIDKGECNCHWCHGSLGIGLSRLLIYHKCNIKSQTIQRDIEFANQSVANSFLTMDDTLCHGNAGKADYFIEAYLLTKDIKYLDYAKRVVNFIIDKNELNTGGPEEIPNFGLFTGIAGIGYELLRIAAPEKVPSVLIIQ